MPLNQNDVSSKIIFHFVFGDEKDFVTHNIVDEIIWNCTQRSQTISELSKWNGLPKITQISN